MSGPVVRRFHKGNCTRCGRKRDADLWCKRCADAARTRGAANRHWPFRSPDELRAYIDAVVAELEREPILAGPVSGDSGAER